MRKKVSNNGARSALYLAEKQRLILQLVTIYVGPGPQSELALTKAANAYRKSLGRGNGCTTFEALSAAAQITSSADDTFSG